VTLEEERRKILKENEKLAGSYNNNESMLQTKED